MNITFTAHCVGHTFFGRGEPGCFHPFDWRFKFTSYERAQSSSIATIRPRMSPPSLCYQSNKTARLHSGAIVGSRNFFWVSKALQVCGNLECRAECWCTVLWHTQCYAATSRTVRRQSASNREARSWTVLFSTWGCPVRRLSWTASLPSGTLWPIVPLCDMATLHRHMLHAVHENILVYYDLVPLNFDPGTLL